MIHFSDFNNKTETINIHMNNEQIIQKTVGEFMINMPKYSNFPVMKHISYARLNTLYTEYKTKYPDSYLNPFIFEDYSKNLSPEDKNNLVNIILDELQYEVSKVLNKDYKYIKESKTVN